MSAHANRQVNLHRQDCGCAIRTDCPVHDAAPEMLEALCRAEDFLEGDWERESMQDRLRWLDITLRGVRIAIAKASGGKP